jgi:BASS family bile acid:Na+ symporter
MSQPADRRDKPAAISREGWWFTGLVIASMILGLAFSRAISGIGAFEPRNLWLFLLVIQLVMFGIGTQMTIRDFKAIARAPRGIVVGIVCRFTVMPLAGFAIAKLLRFDDEIAAGVVLVGSCSSGLSSNVMAYVARANLALSVTVTAATTAIAPVVTPLLMKVLAGRMVAVGFFDMMIEIVTIVLIPIGAALLHDYLGTHPARARRIGALAAGALAWLLFIALGGSSLVMRAFDAPRTAISLFSELCGALVAGTAYHHATRIWPVVPRCMPAVSMAGIAYFIVMTTAAGRDSLLKIGGLLFLASVIHNAAGYFFGYWFGRASGLDENSARSVAFEVGVQNGAMASGIAGAMGKLASLGLAAAVSTPWVNISGSILANYWRQKPGATLAKGSVLRARSEAAHRSETS